MVDRGKRKVIMKDTAFYAIFILIAAGALASVLLLRSRVNPQPAPVAPGASQSDAMLRSGDTRVNVTIADSESERAQGLSGVTLLTDDEGKLFIFEQSGAHGFWMKDMHFAIDIIWLDEAWKVVDITEDATPESYPEVFYPASPARYVLEVNTGFAQAHNISIGSVFVLEE